MNLPLNSLQRLKHKAENLAEDIEALEVLLEVDVPSSLNKIRFITEKVLQALCKSKDVSWGQAEPTLERMVGPLVAADAIPKNIAIHVRTVQMNTSPGSHFQESPLSASHVAIAQNALIEFLEWYCQDSYVHSCGATRDDCDVKSRGVIPRTWAAVVIAFGLAVLAAVWAVSVPELLNGRGLARDDFLLGTWDHLASDSGNWTQLGALKVTREVGSIRITALRQEGQPKAFRILSVKHEQFDGESWKFTAHYADGARGDFHLERVTDDMFQGALTVNVENEPEYKHRLTRTQ